MRADWVVFIVIWTLALAMLVFFGGCAAQQPTLCYPGTSVMGHQVLICYPTDPEKLPPAPMSEPPAPMAPESPKPNA